MTRPVRHPSHRNDRGLTLIEMSIMLAIVAVLATLATTFSRGMVARQMQQGVAAELAADLQWLRMEVTSRGEPLQLTLKRDAAGSCYMIHSGPGSACRCPADGPAMCEAGSSMLKAVHLPASSGISVQSTASSRTFNPGRSAITPTLTVNVLREGGPTIRHIVAITGRVRTCAYNGTIGGFKACD